MSRSASHYNDYYAILEIHRSASVDDVKKAFRALAKRHHPDLNPGNDSSEDAFKLVNEAYAVLGDVDERRSYDATHRFAGLRPGQHPADSGRHSRGRESYADASAAQRARMNEYAARHGGGAGFRAGTGTGFASGPGRPGSDNPNQHMDFDEWRRMQYGPDKQDWDAFNKQRFKEGQARGFANFDQSGTAHQNYEARQQARRQAAAWAAGQAQRGTSETLHYRQWASHYRSAQAADAKAMPMTAATWAIILVVGYFAVRKITEDTR